MKVNRLSVLISALIVVSVSTNIFTMWPVEAYDWPAQQRYEYAGMFDDSLLMYRPAGTEGLAILDMDNAVITISEFGEPLNCAQLNIHTNEGTIPGPCIEGLILSE